MNIGATDTRLMTAKMQCMQFKLLKLCVCFGSFAHIVRKLYGLLGEYYGLYLKYAD